MQSLENTKSILAFHMVIFIYLLPNYYSIYWLLIFKFLLGYLFLFIIYSIMPFMCLKQLHVRRGPFNLFFSLRLWNSLQSLAYALSYVVRPALAGFVLK